MVLNQINVDLGGGTEGGNPVQNCCFWQGLIITSRDWTSRAIEGEKPTLKKIWKAIPTLFFPIDKTQEMIVVSPNRKLE